MTATLSAQRILRLNALTGLISGSVLTLAAGAVASLLGLGQYEAAVPAARATGIGLVFFAALLLWVARRPVAPAAMMTIGVVDGLWVAASAGLLVARALPLSAAGVWIVALQADVIGVLCALELRHWWRARGDTSADAV